MIHAVLGRTVEDPIGAMIAEAFKSTNPGYLNFESPFGLTGLAKEYNGTLEILAIEASEPGTGQFNRFLKMAQSIYKRIIILEVWNKTFDASLENKGFKPFKMEKEMELVTGRVWEAK